MTALNATADAFETFAPRDYLTEYYARVEGENERLLAFHAVAHRLLPAGGTMLELGGGPTMYQLISAAASTTDIHFAEYLPANLREVQAWLDDKPGAFDWTPFVAAALLSEGAEPTSAAVADREALMRTRVSRLLLADVYQPEPLGEPACYDTVAANFVMESVTANAQDWRRAMTNALSLVGPGGFFITTVITGAEYWRSGEREFPAFSLSAQTLEDELREFGFDVLHVETLDADITDPASPDYEGYDGMAMLVARRAD